MLTNNIWQTNNLPTVVAN